MAAKATEKEAWSFTKWYESHGGELNKKRMSKYKTDPEYRERVLQLNRDSRERRREAIQKEQAVEKKAIKVQTPAKHWKEFTDSDNKLFSIGALARVLGKSVQAVRIWEKQGVIPKAKNRNKKGDRLYTAAELLNIRTSLLSKGLVHEGLRPKAEPRTRFMKLRLNPSGKVCTEQVFGIGGLASAISRSVVTVEQMERKKALPETPLRTPKKHRMYTAEMITVVKNAMEKQQLRTRGCGWEEFAEEVFHAWKALGVIDCEILDTNAS